jgi:oligoribonuclease NrnB/cAMP/cGMP phosphodiesterase (DHH superfamily)
MASVKVLYHANCTDGFGAAYAAWTQLGDSGVEYIAVNYGEEPPDVTDDLVYILDFSYKKPLLDRMIEQAGELTLIDHHKKAFEELGFEEFNKVEIDKDGCNIILDRNKSGAMLAWEYFVGDRSSDLIRAIDDYDRWQFKLEYSKALHNGLWSMTPWSFKQWKELNLIDVIEKGRILLDDHDRKVRQLMKDPIQLQITSPNDVLSWTGLCANAPRFFASDLGHHLALKSGTFGLVWNLIDPNTAQCSLRSNGDYDVSAIAKHFGGGGHKNAAGMRVDIKTLLKWMYSNT